MKKGLTFQFLSYNEIGNIESNERIKRILKIVKENKILLLEGRMNELEQTMLIQKTMREINKKFQGIEIATFEGKAGNAFVNMLNSLERMIFGDKSGFTIIGPASIVKEIKKDPNKIELFTKS
mgnify:CR=1 FL=1